MLKAITGRAWAALTVLGAIVLVFFLPLSWKQRADAAAAWGPVLQSPSLQTALLLAYATFMTAWLFWIDIRPELQRRRAAKAANAPETADAIQLKQEVVAFATNQLREAFTDATEAGRISAYTVRDSWDHPANFLVWQAFAQLGSFDPSYFRLTSDAPAMLRLRKDNVQRIVIELLKQYRLKQHRLVTVVKLLAEHQKPLTPNNFDGLLRKWLDSHSKMMEALKRLQALPGLETLRGYDTHGQLEQQEYLPAIIEQALGPA